MFNRVEIVKAPIDLNGEPSKAMAGEIATAGKQLLKKAYTGR